MNVEQQAEGREEEVKQNIRAKFAQALHDCGEIILPIAQENAPYKTGRYKRSLGYEVNDAKLEAQLYSNRKIAPHAHLLEWGTSKMAPRAPLRKAAEEARDKMGDAVARRMGEPV
jgi:HK97 gp10 family phage protein